MGLQDLNEDIYRRDYQDVRETKTEYDPDNKDTRPDEKITFERGKWNDSIGRETWAIRTKEFLIRKWKWVVLTIVGAFLLIGIANIGTFREMLFSEDRMSIEMSGPVDVVSVEPVEYTVKYRNENVLSAKNLELVISLPESFRMEKQDGMELASGIAVIRLPDIEGGLSGEWKFSGRFFGSKGSLSYFKSDIRFSPAGISSRLSRESSFGVTIVSSPIVLEVSAPQEAASGNEVEYAISYRNDGDLSFPNVRVRAEYPEGFQFGQSEPKAAEGDALWRIGNLLPGSSGEIRIKGSVFGSGDQAKVIRVSIGTLQGDGTMLSYDRTERTTRIISPPLLITQEVNGKTDAIVNPGESLNYSLRYRNNSSIGMRDVIITVKIDPSFIDLTRLSLRGGAYDPIKEMIIWKAPDIPGLARLEPGQGGSVGFSVPVREDIGTSGTAGKHLSVATLARIDSPDVPFSSGSGKIISSNPLDVKIGSVVQFRVFVIRNDEAIKNEGPFPPKVGEETNYTIHVKATNFLNDLSGAKVSMTLPTAIRYTGKFFPGTETLSYNDRTGKLSWDIGSLWGGGKTERELIFQVGLTPGPNEIGKTPMLLSEAVFDAKDLFTERTLQSSINTISSAPSEDESVRGEDFDVVP